jgi:hypothetical protein
VSIVKMEQELQFLIDNRSPLEWPDTIVERYAVRNDIKIDWTWSNGGIQIIALSKEE